MFYNGKYVGRRRMSVLKWKLQKKTVERNKGSDSDSLFRSTVFNCAPSDVRFLKVKVPNPPVRGKDKAGGKVSRVISNTQRGLITIGEYV